MGWRAHAITGEPPNGKVQPCLLLAVGIRARDGTVVQIQALVDTGSDINLIRRNLVPAFCLDQCARHMQIMAANNMDMGGNHRLFNGHLIISGKPPEPHLPRELEIPLKAYDADIDVDAILSYEWMASQGIDVYPRQHGVSITYEHGKFGSQG